MNIISNFIFIMTMPIVLINSLLFIGTVIAFLESAIGVFAYVAWIFVLPAFCPAFLFLPWFDAWVEGSNNLNDVILFSWSIFWTWGALNLSFFLFYPDHPPMLTK